MTVVNPPLCCSKTSSVTRSEPRTAGVRSGLQGRSLLLGLVVFMEGLALLLFSRLTSLVPAIAVFLVFGLFVCMACGVTYAVVPLVRPRAIGSASGIVGAGGNVGGSSRGFSFQVGKIVERKRVFLPGTVRSGLRVLRSAVAFSWSGRS